MKTKVEKMFGTYVCSDFVLKKYMSPASFAKYIKTKNKGEELDVKTAKAVAKAVKKWAIKMGATHYSHWFMPLTNKTAEKQISFVEIMPNGKLIEDFSEKSLIKGEADASSFPNGGARMTFEARGYTVWDYTSPLFIKEDSAKNRVVYIPTAFCSYDGIALDEKTPLLRALESLNFAAKKVLKHLGYDKVKKVDFFVGAEQEYFLIKTKDFENRVDLKFTGRAIFGAEPIKEQEVCSHYYGMIDDDISKFMNQVDQILWKMGITAKLQHNEVAPCQHEFVPIFNAANIASDQNQLIMQVIDNVAKQYGYTALFHEKPFSHLNGSGKHINWSMSTDTGLQLLDINQKDKMVFYAFFSAIISAIDKYYKLIRLSTAYRANDLRLGGNEAPPTIISVFASEYVLNQIDSIKQNQSAKNSKTILDTGVKTMPKMEKDFCDRNRTSPFAFTGNKFEFRMVGSSQCLSWPITCICTVLANELNLLSEKLDKTNGTREEMVEIFDKLMAEHKRIIYNGNGYDKSWHKEAKKRGFEEYNDSSSIYSILGEDDITKLFADTNVLCKQELELRQSTLYQNYANQVLLEAKSATYMIEKQVLPCLIKYDFSLLKFENKKLVLSKIKDIENSIKLLATLNKDLKKEIEIVDKIEKNSEKTAKINKKMLNLLQELQKEYAKVENMLPENLEPFVTINKILF